MKIKNLLILVFLLAIFTNSVSAGSYPSWYFKKNGNLQPKLDKPQEIIFQYNGYYLDKNYTDESSERVLYLTFDVGYENGNVAKIVDALNAEGVKGSFFVLSGFVRKNPELLKEMVEAGHLMCNHSSNHINFPCSTNEEATKSIQKLEAVYKEATGKEISKFFRFPEGAYNEEKLKLVSDMGYKTVFWSLAYADWDDKKQPNEDKAIKILLENTHNGAIILLHPTSSTNAKIIPTLLKEWKKMGYRFETLDNL